MPFENNVAFRRRFVDGTALGQFSASTKKLFKAIDDEILEDFKQALEEGADVNAFDKEYTPLMTIIMNGDDSPIHLKMMTLLLHNQNLNVNIQETKQLNTALHLAFLMENRSFVEILLRSTNLDINVKNRHLLIKPEYRNLLTEYVCDYHKECFFHAPKEYIEKIGEVQKKNFSYLTIEIQKAQEGKNLLNALSSENFYEAKQDLNPNCWESNLNEEIETPLISGNVHEAKRLLNQELNPNCWKSLNGEIETPLSLIIKSCLQGITQENEEVLTKLLKHKELDFSQIKPAQAIERNPRVKQIIEQAMKERLTNAINRKDLGDVKKLVEDNCFINHAIVTAALRNVNNPIGSIKNYLTANSHNVALEIDDALIAQLEDLKGELERTKIRLREKEQELNRTVDERTRDTDKISQLERDLRQERLELQTQNQDLKNKNRKLSEANIYNRRQSNYASASFVLSEAFAIGTCLTIFSLAICIPLAVAAFVFLTIGCYCSYKANTVLSDVTSTQFGNAVNDLRRS
ncbi:Ankyrin repeats (3 copies) [Wolbachia endosymbiont of Cylisticus convexus]|uniref:ankyrin repeat domain-containing protein n=1 Tax=Wolbachia endosymbiont of Cylisticus convexus TaxID=118728 RepID=UPI000DF6AF1B|nr:ankyrin repeat domain-containing protein [Wolbachia endosymbiont of Cylisticus convexus]RDD34733.1 Ankyrin repeats (3 copies) [Wolbachia endosymbiont of Cylisticus convexus]